MEKILTPHHLYVLLAQCQNKSLSASTKCQWMRERDCKGLWRALSNEHGFHLARIMITIQDLYNIVGNKIANETGKEIIRNNFPPQIAEQMCNAIDGQERAEHFQRLLKEYNEWMQYQQRQQEAVQRFLREYYH